MSRSRFHGCGEEMVKGAAMETVLLLRQCPLSVAENYAVAVRDMSCKPLSPPPLAKRPRIPYQPEEEDDRL
jgi:hypothetical protein